MAVYLVSGKLGGGKTLACVNVIREALRMGRRVASNLDLDLAHLVKSDNKTARVVRIPDKPSGFDLEVLGLGTDVVDESMHGVVVLDELASWLNARTYQDKTRAHVLDWLIHSRKLGWDVYFVCQNIAQVDKQLRESLVEYLVTCRRLDRLKVPVVGGLIRAVTSGVCSGALPKVHVAIVRYGVEHLAPIADRWVYRGHDLYQAYDTRQVFSDQYPHGVYSVLPPGYYAVPVVTWIDRFKGWWLRAGSGAARRVALRPKLPAVQQLALLDPDEAVKEWQRLDSLGQWT